jgi:hypothetical protein
MDVHHQAEKFFVFFKICSKTVLLTLRNTEERKQINKIAIYNKELKSTNERLSISLLIREGQKSGFVPSHRLAKPREPVKNYFVRLHQGSIPQPQAH